MYTWASTDADVRVYYCRVLDLLLCLHDSTPLNGGGDQRHDVYEEAEKKLLKRCDERGAQFEILVTGSLTVQRDDLEERETGQEEGEMREAEK